MILKDNKFIEIFNHIKDGITYLQEENIELSEDQFKKALDICVNLDTNDLDVSDYHIHAIMNTEKIEDEEMAKKYILHQLKNINLKNIIARLLILNTFVYLEKFQDENL